MNPFIHRRLAQAAYDCATHRPNAAHTWLCFFFFREQCYKFRKCCMNGIHKMKRKPPPPIPTLLSPFIVCIVANRVCSLFTIPVKNNKKTTKNYMKGLTNGVCRWYNTFAVLQNKIFGIVVVDIKNIKKNKCKAPFHHKFLVVAYAKSFCRLCLPVACFI